MSGTSGSSGRTLGFERPVREDNPRLTSPRFRRFAFAMMLRILEVAPGNSKGKGENESEMFSKSAVNGRVNSSFWLAPANCPA